MTPSILTIESTERIPKSSFHWVWLGFIFVLAFGVLETLMMVVELDETRALLLRYLDGGVGLLLLFGIIAYLSAKAEATR